jgi:hypothetical protein
LGTFFAQIFSTARKPVQTVCWVGTSIKEIQTVGELAQAIHEHADIPADIRHQLETDQHAMGFRPSVGTQVLQHLQRAKEARS